MAFPDDVLDDGEHVVLHGRPHWRSCLRPAAVLLLVAALVGFAAAVVRLQPWAPFAWAGLALLGGVVVTRATVLPLVRWRCSHLVVTTRRFLVREGVVTRDGLDVPIERIDAVRVRAATVDRLFGSGVLLLDVAGQRLRFERVPRVERVQARLHREIGRAAEAGRRTGRESEHTLLRGDAGSAARERMTGRGTEASEPRAVPERTAS